MGIRPSDLKGPLSQFQALENSKEGTWKLVSTIYRASQARNISETQLHKIFERFWPDLESQFKRIDLTALNERVVRTERSMLEEILLDVRSIKMNLPIIDAVQRSRNDETPALEGDHIALMIDVSKIDNKSRRLKYVIDSKESFQALLNTLWGDEISKKYEAFTYGSRWILVNELTGERVNKIGRLDGRSIKQLGFVDGQPLRVEPVSVKL